MFLVTFDFLNCLNLTKLLCFSICVGRWNEEIILIYIFCKIANTFCSDWDILKVIKLTTPSVKRCERVGGIFPTFPLQKKKSNKKEPATLELCSALKRMIKVGVLKLPCPWALAYAPQCCFAAAVPCQGEIIIICLIGQGLAAHGDPFWLPPYFKFIHFSPLRCFP